MSPRLSRVFAAALVLAIPLTGGAASATQLNGGRQAFLFLVDRLSFEDLLRIPEVRGVASQEGAGVLSSRTPLREALQTGLATVGAQMARRRVIVDLGSAEAAGGGVAPETLKGVGQAIRDRVAASKADDVLIVVATPTPSGAMRTTKDELTGIAIGRGSPRELISAMDTPPAGDALTSVTSDSTGRGGVVSSLDVAPTIDDFLGAPVDPAGSAIRPTVVAVPLDLHARYLANRRMSVPIQTAAGVYVTVVGLVGVALLVRRHRVPRSTLRFGGWLAMSLIPLSIALLEAGRLPTLSYGTVVAFVVAFTALGTFAFTPIARARGPFVAAAAMGLAGLVAIGLEASFGWSAALLGFLGGTQLDGGRFFGLPNVYIGLLLGCSLFVASRIERAAAGAALIAAVALFAGLPWTGANLGGAIALSAASGLWFGVRRSGRLGMLELGYALVFAAVGTLAVIGANRHLVSTPNHITRFVEGGADPVAAFVDRLKTGARLIARDPFALIPVIGVPACLVVVLGPPGPIRRSFERSGAWRDALLVILLGSIVAYVANDSGSAALGLGFGTALAGMLFASLEVAAESRDP